MTIEDFIRARLDEDERDIDTRDHDSGQCDYLRGVHHEPERALREVAAKRALLAAYEDATEFSDPWIGLDAAVRICAAVWSDHPDYRPEWAPDAHRA